MKQRPDVVAVRRGEIQAGPADHVADRVDVWNGGLVVLVNGDDAALVRRYAQPFKTDAVGVALAPVGPQLVVALDTLIGFQF